MLAFSASLASSKLHTRALILEFGLNAAQAKKAPSLECTRTVSPGSAEPLAMDVSNTQGCPLSKERSLPGLKVMVFMAECGVLLGSHAASAFLGEGLRAKGELYHC